MNHIVRHIFLLISALSLFTYCTSTGERDESIACAATELTLAARDELGLSDEQKDKLETAAYSFIQDMENGQKGLNDPVARAEVQRKAIAKFKCSLEKDFPKPMTAEIIAWYYKYSNGKKQYE